jgi:hypothetical protein
MKKIQILLITIMFSIAPSVYSEILEVYNWKANPGQVQKMLTNMNESAQIHRDLGAQVTINILDVGSENQIDYVVRFDDIIQWGAFKDKLVTDKKWNALWTKVSKKPTGELQMSLVGINTDSTVKASDFNKPFVYGVWVWDPAPGRTADLMEIQQKYKKIHESLGARVEIYSEGPGGTGSFHYCILFDTWSDWADWTVKAGSSTELAELNSQNDPTGATLVRSFSGRTVSN